MRTRLSGGVGGEKLRDFPLSRLMETDSDCGLLYWSAGRIHSRKWLCHKLRLQAIGSWQLACLVVTQIKCDLEPFVMGLSAILCNRSSSPLAQSTGV